VPACCGYRQAVPSHRRIKVVVLPRLLLLANPTAQASLGETAATPWSSLLPRGEGLGTRCHAVPFHRSVTVFVGLSPSPETPAAQTLR
jgi:hypothetical protein